MTKLSNKQKDAIDAIFRIYKDKGISVDKAKYGYEHTPHRTLSFLWSFEVGFKSWNTFEDDLSQSLKHRRQECRHKMVRAGCADLSADAAFMIEIWQAYFKKNDPNWFTCPDVVRCVVGEIEMLFLDKLSTWSADIHAIQEMAKRIQLYEELSLNSYFKCSRQKKFISVLNTAKSNMVDSLRYAMDHFANRSIKSKCKDLKHLVLSCAELAKSAFCSPEIVNYSSTAGRCVKLIEYTFDQEKKMVQELMNLKTQQLEEDNLPAKPVLPFNLEAKNKTLEIQTSVEDIWEQDDNMEKDALLKFEGWMDECYKKWVQFYKEYQYISRHALSSKLTRLKSDAVRQSKGEYAQAAKAMNGNFLPDATSACMSRFASRFRSKEKGHSGLVDRKHHNKDTLNAILDLHIAYFAFKTISLLADMLIDLTQNYGDYCFYRQDFKISIKTKKKVESFFRRLYHSGILEGNIPSKFNSLKNSLHDPKSNKKRDLSYVISVQSVLCGHRKDINDLKPAKGILTFVSEVMHNIFTQEKVDTTGIETGKIDNFLKKYSGLAGAQLGHLDYDSNIAQMMLAASHTKDMTVALAGIAGAVYLAYTQSKKVVKASMPIMVN